MTEQRRRGQIPGAASRPAASGRSGGGGQTSSQEGEPAEGRQEAAQGQQEPLPGQRRRLVESISLARIIS